MSVSEFVSGCVNSTVNITACADQGGIATDAGLLFIIAVLALAMATTLGWLASAADGANDFFCTSYMIQRKRFIFILTVALLKGKVSVIFFSPHG